MKHKINSGWVPPLLRITRVIFSPAPTPVFAIVQETSKKGNLSANLKKQIKPDMPTW
jgi:hypothetical protein